MKMFPLNVATMNLPNLESIFRDANAPPTVGYNPTIKNEMDISDSEAAMGCAKADLSNLKVTVGIDEDLQMILEMDPSIVDLVRNSI